MKKLDLVVRSSIIAIFAVLSAVACHNMLEEPGTLATFRTDNIVVDNLSGFGTTTPTQQVQVESSARTCTPGVNNCLPVQVTEYVVAAPSISFRRAFGTLAAPTTLTAKGDFIAQLRAEPYTTTGFIGQSGLPQVFLEIANNETGSPTATAQGTYMGLRYVPVGAANSTMGAKLDNGNFAVATGLDTATVNAKLEVVSTDIGSGAGAAATAWNNTYSIFGPSTNSATGAGLGLGYSATDGQAVIASSQPGTAFKPLQIFSTIVKVITQPLQVERIINTNDAPSVTCDGGAVVSQVGGEHMGHVVPAIDTTTCQVRFAHPPASCACSLAVDHVEIATGIGHSCTISVNDLHVTAAPSTALGTFDYVCSMSN